MPAIPAPHTTTTIFFFFPQPQATPASHQLHTSHSGVGIQTLVRVGGNESIEGARGGGRTRHTSRLSRQTHLNSLTVTKNASKKKQPLLHGCCTLQTKKPEVANTLIAAALHKSSCHCRVSLVTTAQLIWGGELYMHKAQLLRLCYHLLCQLRGISAADQHPISFCNFTLLMLEMEIITRHHLKQHQRSLHARYGRSILVHAAVRKVKWASINCLLVHSCARDHRIRVHPARFSRFFRLSAVHELVHA